MSFGGLKSWFSESPKWVQEATCSACSIVKLQATAVLKDPILFLKTYLKPLLVANWLERTIPGKPRCNKQKYLMTEKGRQIIGERTGGI